MEADTSIRALPPVLSTEEVAELLRLNVKTVLAMARDGRLPAHRLPGARKVQYLATEVLATLAKAPAGGTSDDAEPPLDVGADGGSCSPPPPGEVDPCDVWAAAPADSVGNGWEQRCSAHWIELATRHGLSAVGMASADAVGASAGHRAAGRVEIDGLAYEIRVGPRQRTRYVDDDGDVRWGLIDAVWVEPVRPD
jgi:excisionase family DNA binding protein